MKDFSKVIHSKEYEKIFWSNIFYQLSGDTGAIKILAFNPLHQKKLSLKENDLCFIYIDEGEFSSYQKGDDILFYGIKYNYPKNTNNICASASLSLAEYELYKNGDLKCIFKPEDGIEITIEDVPNVYKLLGD